MAKMKAYKFRLYPSKMQTGQMNRHRWLAKNLWNGLLAHCKGVYEKTGRFPTKTELQIKTKNSGMYSQASQNVAHKIYNSMVRYFKLKKENKKAGFPRFKSIDRLKSIHYPQSGFGLGTKFKVSPFGEISIKKHREIKGTIKTLTLKRESSGKWFAVFCVESKPEPPKANNGCKIGVDLGLKSFAAFSNGVKVDNPRHLKKYESRLAFLQKKLSGKKKGSGNRKKQKTLVARLHEKVANARKDFLHKLSHRLVADYSLLALEKLEAIKMAGRNYGKQINDAGWATFADMLSYKAENAGCKVVFVDPKNTTRECHVCGKTKDMPLSERTYNCTHCGAISDRDINAAINILNRATAGMAGSNACRDGC